VINNLITISIVHLIRMHFSHHLFLIIVSCPHIVGLAIERSSFSILVGVIVHLINVIVKVCSIIDNINVVVVEHFSVFVVLLTIFLLLVLLSARLAGRATLAALHVHQVVLDVSIELYVQLAANVANDVSYLIEILSIFDVIIFEVVEELLFVLVCVVFLVFFPAKAEDFSVFFFVVW